LKGRAEKQRKERTAVSSRGLGHSPLKAGTRVRIPLPLLTQLRRTGERPVRLSVRTAPFHGAERGSIPLRAIRFAPECTSVPGPHVTGMFWGRSSVWLEHSTVTREVAGSSPVGPVVRTGGGKRGKGDRSTPLSLHPSLEQCPGGEIGRHAILRGWCRKASRFESAPGHS
jgi:hypothetical protein